MRTSTLAFCVALGSVMAAAAPLLAVQDQQKPASQPSADSRPQTSPSASANDEGELVFEQNCARCHNAPTGFPSRVTGAIVRHMRVRANLSRHQEEVLLHYFTP